MSIMRIFQQNGHFSKILVVWGAIRRNGDNFGGKIVFFPLFIL